jgi:hypothetical protein
VPQVPTPNRSRTAMHCASRISVVTCMGQTDRQTNLGCGRSISSPTGP